MPLGQMPVLEIDGKKMCQSAAIGRYLANKYGLLGSTEMDKYWADMYLETLEDLFKKFPFTERDEEKKVRGRCTNYPIRNPTRDHYHPR